MSGPRRLKNQLPQVPPQEEYLETEQLQTRRNQREQLTRRHLKKANDKNYGKVILALLLVVALIAAAWYAYTLITTNPYAKGIPRNLKSYYKQNVNWTSCENGMQCATVEAPVDWDNPSSDKVSLQLIKINATGQKQGSLVINPGGPGGSGYDWVRDSAMSTLSSTVTSAYDVVGFDPRGVGKSSAIKCLDDKDHDAYRANTANLDTDDGLQKLRDEYAKIAQSCKDNSGPVIGHMDTASVAKDMDMIRALLKENQLNYLGFSYGTLLGASYAGLFPDHVGHMVLDGAVDPAISYSEVTKGQATGFEQSLKAFANDCVQKKNCSLSQDDQGNTLSADDIVKKVRQMLTDNNTSPMKTKDGRTATSSMLVQGIMVPLYNNLMWPTLADALASAMYNKSPDSLIQFSDASAGRSSDGSYSNNSDFAFMAVNCLDYSIPSDTQSIRSDEAALKKASPTFGQYMAGGGAICEKWPYKTIRQLGPISTSSSNPLLVVGTSGDPATPFASAENLTKELGNAKLLKWNGQGHTAYGRSNDCVRDSVDNFLLKGTVPEDGKTC
ncbi:MAG: alpha/beta hydrolase [Micrococcaceae bacterium]